MLQREKHKSEVYQALAHHPELAKTLEILAGYLEQPIWWISPDAKQSGPEQLKLLKHLSKKCHTVNKNKLNCANFIYQLMEGSEKTKLPQKGICPDGAFAFSIPIIQGDMVYGYIVSCHAKKEISEALLGTFKAFCDTLLREVQKELELSKLYETIRPRAIALSTIHTVHRLISSTLKLEELLPRIARLSLQIMRAKECSIFLVDENRKSLIPKASVNVETKKTEPGRPLKIGSGLIGKVVQTGKGLLAPQQLIIPLVSEDIIGVIAVAERVDGKPFTIFDQEILTVMGEQAVIAIKNAQLYEEQEKLTLGAIRSLGMILSSKLPDEYSGVPESLIKIMLAMAEEMGLSAEEKTSLHYAALIHDAGQAVIPQEILTKPRTLTQKEYKVIKDHPVRGVEIIEPLEAIKPIIPIIMHHHEKYDGTGYPKGLKGDEIPLGARILAVASSFIAMITPRPYRPALKIKVALEEIKTGGSTYFDPKVVEVFMAVVHRPDIMATLKSEGRE